MPNYGETVLTKYESTGFDNYIKEQERIAKNYDTMAKAERDAAKAHDEYIKKAAANWANYRKGWDDSSKSHDKFGKSVEAATTKLGKLSSFGRDLSQAGNFLGSDTIAALGNFANGLGDIGQSIEGVLKRTDGLKGFVGLLKTAGVIGIGGAAVAGIDTLLQHPFQRELGGLTSEATGAGASARAQLAALGIQLPDLSKLGQESKDATKYVDAAANALIDFNNQVYDLTRALGKINDPAVAKAVGAVNVGLDKILGGPLGAFGIKTPFGAVGTAASDRAIDIQKDIEKRHQDDLDKIILEGRRRVAKSLADSANEQNRLNQSAINSQRDYQKRLADINKEGTDQRIKLALDYADKVKQLEEDYYANRAALVKNFDKETQRLEQDHQIQMRRLSQDHDKRLRKLAESRDALGVEDENQSYKEERDRAEEDFQLNMQRRNQDYADQLRALEDNFRKQRDQQKTAYDTQLNDLNQHLQNQYTLTREWYKAIEDDLKAKIAAASTTPASTTGGPYPGGLSHPGRAGGGYIGRGLFMGGELGREFVLSHSTTRAAEAMAGGALNQGNILGSTSFIVNQSFSGQESSPEVYRRIVYDTVVDLFQRAKR